MPNNLLFRHCAAVAYLAVFVIQRLFACKLVVPNTKLGFKIAERAERLHINAVFLCGGTHSHKRFRRLGMGSKPWGIVLHDMIAGATGEF